MLKSFSIWMCLILGYVSPRGISLRVDAKKGCLRHNTYFLKPFPVIQIVESVIIKIADPPNHRAVFLKPFPHPSRKKSYKGSGPEI